MSLSANMSNPQTLPELLAGPVALFLDFDGVIAEIAPTPDAVVVEPSTIARLQSLNSALDGALAIVSGRDIEAVDGLVRPLELAVAGDHGNTRRRPDGGLVVGNDEAMTAAAELSHYLLQRFAADPRILVESKPSAVALHYRLAPERSGECEAVLREALPHFPELSAIAGKMVIEARAEGATKGRAVRDFMAEVPFAGRAPLFVGDDVTDEDGFAAAQGLGGVGIKVGGGDTVAAYRIGSTRDVGPLLDTIIRRQGWTH
jgi:trehalose 6-phosphate phosphatase